MEIAIVTKRLSELAEGETGIIRQLLTPDVGMRQRLMEMGFTTGTAVLVERYAPLDDPAEYKLLGYHVSLRRLEADSILVEQ